MNVRLKLFFPTAPTRHTTFEFDVPPSLRFILSKLEKEFELPSFTQNNRVRSNFLILVNDVQHELQGSLDQALQDGDIVTILSLVHGGVELFSKKFKRWIHFDRKKQ